VDLEIQYTANAVTWLDRKMISEAPLSLVDNGFGRDVRDAMAARKR